jgi:hypothetical protein
MTDTPPVPGNDVHGRWPGPTMRLDSDTPSRNTVRREIDGICTIPRACPFLGAGSAG